MRLFLTIKLGWLLIFFSNNLYIEVMGRRHGGALGLAFLSFFLRRSYSCWALCACVRVLKTKRPDCVSQSPNVIKS